LIVHRRDDVAVGLKRDRDVGVSKPFRNDLRLDPALKGQRRPGVAEIVETLLTLAARFGMVHPMLASALVRGRVPGAKVDGDSAAVADRDVVLLGPATDVDGVG